MFNDKHLEQGRLSPYPAVCTNFLSLKDDVHDTEGRTLPFVFACIYGICILWRGGSMGIPCQLVSTEHRWSVVMGQMWPFLLFLTFWHQPLPVPGVAHWSVLCLLSPSWMWGQKVFCSCDSPLWWIFLNSAGCREAGSFFRFILYLNFLPPGARLCLTCPDAFSLGILLLWQLLPRAWTENEPKRWN